MNARQYKKKRAKASWWQPAITRAVFTTQENVPRRIRTCFFVAIEAEKILGKELFSRHIMDEIVGNFMTSPEVQNCISYEIELYDYFRYKVTAEMTLLSKGE